MRSKIKVQIPQKFRQISGVLLFQILAFVLTFGTNILIIRQMSKEDYGLFTICLLMLGVVSNLSDSGITPSFRRLAGRFYQQPHIFSEIVMSKIELRNQILLFVLPVSLGLSFYLFYEQSSSISRILVCLLLLCLLIFLEIQKGIYMEILRSYLKIRTVQLIDNLLNFSRIVFVLICFYFLNLYVLLIAYVAAGLIVMIYAKRQAEKYYDPTVKARKMYKKIMSAKYKELLPNSVFYIFQSQVALFVLSYFHKSNGVANYGALTRITILYTMLTAVILNIFTIQFSRYQDTKMLRREYVRLLGALLLITSFVLGAIYLLRHVIIGMLGKNYAGLENLLIVLTVIGSINFILGSIYMMNNAKAWIYFNARYAIPVSILSLIAGAFVLDFNNLEQAVAYSFLPIFFTGFLKIADSMRGLRIAFYK